jgi:hypothetical protein
MCGASQQHSTQHMLATACCAFSSSCSMLCIQISCRVAAAACCSASRSVSYGKFPQHAPSTQPNSAEHATSRVCYSRAAMLKYAEQPSHMACQVRHNTTTHQGPTLAEPDL